MLSVGSPPLIEFLILFFYFAIIAGSVVMALSWWPAAFSLWKMQVRSLCSTDQQEIEAGTAGFYTRLVHNLPVLGPCWAMRWAKGFQIALALTEHSIFMAVACLLRITQLMLFNDNVIGTGDFFIALFLLGLADSNRRLVRASAITPGRTLRWPWYAYNAAVAIAAFGVGLLATMAWMGYA
jgi:hypothetical protein